MTLDKFTVKAQEAVMRAQQSAQENGQQQIEVEHLFKSLLDDVEGVPQAVLKKIGANVGLVQSRIDDEIRKLPRVSGGGAVGSVYLSPRTNNVLNSAMNEMRELKDEYVSTEHLLLAILNEKGSPSANMLQSQGVTKDA
ncbi:MAG: type VI secretion system ATPase TssH, partial [bacterium]|nr:type VI secretion system ATPase TssH [bacterium]